MRPYNLPFGEPGWFEDANATQVSSNVHDVVQQENVPGATEPVTLAQAKAQCRVDFNDDDSDITDLITAARQVIENYCSISLLPKNITVVFDLQARLELPYGPILTDPVVTGFDGNVIDPSAYTLYGVKFKYLEPMDYFFNKATMTYKAGYDGMAFAIERDLVRAVLAQIAFLYEHKGDDADTRKSVNPGICEEARVLAAPYIRTSWV